MMVLMRADATAAQIETIMERIGAFQMQALRLPGDERVAIGVASAIPPEVREPLTEALTSLPGVDHVVQISRPYKRASREFQQVDTVIHIKDVTIGANACVVIAGPCSVESREQIFETARAVQSAGAKVLRGGAYKPRTSPYAFQGLGEEGLRLLKEVGDELGIVTVTEVMAPEDVPLVAAHARHSANRGQKYAELPAADCGRQKRASRRCLKRGPSASLDEFLLAAEYLLHHGTPNVILCERGVHPLDRAYTRNTLDLNAVPVLKQMSHLPVIDRPVARHGRGPLRSRAVPRQYCGGSGRHYRGSASQPVACAFRRRTIPDARRIFRPDDRPAENRRRYGPFAVKQYFRVVHPAFCS